MRQVRIGMVGLGNIAQKAYLPILTRETDWKLVGAYSPTASRRREVCRQYRMQEYHRLSDLISDCDALFVHSSTESHYEIVSEALQQGVDVYVDKPLAATLPEAEKLVELATKQHRKLMVGFNRRFAPMYVAAKEKIQNLAWVRLDKHRTNSIGPHSYRFKMLDDYIHVVDTIRWLIKDEVRVIHQQVQVNDDNQLVYANHLYASPSNISLNTSMHRKAGTNLEQLELVGEDALIRVKNMNVMEVEQNGIVTTKTPGSWETVLKQRGFEGAIHHFIDCVVNDIQPVVDGEEGLKSQQLIETLLAY